MMDKETFLREVEERKARIKIKIAQQEQRLERLDKRIENMYTLFNELKAHLETKKEATKA